MSDAETTPRPPTSKAEARARAGWASVRQRLRAVAPVDVGRRLLAAVVLALLGWLVVASWPALLPFAGGALLAYALLPPVNALNRVLPRPLAALLTLLAFIALTAALVYALLPPLVGQLLRFYRATLNPDALAEYAAQIDLTLRGLPEPSRSLLHDYFDQVRAVFQARVDASIAALAGASVAGSIGIVDTLSSVIGLVLLPLWMVSILAGSRSIAPALRGLLPDWLAPDVWALIRIVDRVLNAFLRGQLLLGIAAGVTLYGEVVLLERFTSIQFHYPVLMAVFAALPPLVPQIGPLLGVIVFAILGFGISPQTGILLVVLYALALLIVSTLVAPHLQRRLTDLNPALLVVFITALSTFGLVWALLSAPLLAIARDILRYARGRIADRPSPAGLLPGDVAPPSTMQPAAGRHRRGRAVERGRARARTPADR